MKKPAEMINAFLKLLGLGEAEWPLRTSVSISIVYCLDNSWRLFWILKVVKYNVFANSLKGATIQDSSKRERNNRLIVLKLN